MSNQSKWKLPNLRREMTRATRTVAVPQRLTFGRNGTVSEPVAEVLARSLAWQGASGLELVEVDGQEAVVRDTVDGSLQRRAWSLEGQEYRLQAASEVWS